MTEQTRKITCMISIHALRKERDRIKAGASVIDGISIHALRKERDHITIARANRRIISIQALR